MEFRFVKAIQFTRLVKAHGRLREFNFRRVNNAEGESFSVNVCDDRGERILFRMKKDNNSWHFVNQPLPVWVLEQEERLHELIEEELHA
ncbi:MAG TPA: hypothetical protein VF476_00240 [Chitinophagaceae bacterium]